MENLNLGEMISMFYQEYLDMYGDEELASVAAAATINDLLNQTEDGIRLQPLDDAPPEHLAVA